MTQQQVTIILWVGGEGWKRFNYPSEETSQALKERGITIGNGASIGYGVSIGYEASIGDEASIGNWASIGDEASIGYGVSIGYEASIGNGVSIGNGASIGYGVSIGYEASIGYGVSIGYEASIGDDASIGNGASIGYRARIEKTIFLTGSRNTVNYYGMDMIHIGCIRKTIAEWQQQYREVGMENGYSDEQIEEYGAYIKMIAELHKTWNIETPAAQ